MTEHNNGSGILNRLNNRFKNILQIIIPALNSPENVPDFLFCSNNLKGIYVRDFDLIFYLCYLLNLNKLTDGKI